MKRLTLLILLSSPALLAAGRHAKNVILFIGDAGGIPTLNAASIYGYKQPQKLFIQHMPHLGLMDTSSADSWVTDSAAGITAIVTGRKTDNEVLSETPLNGTGSRQPLKTILEYAEEHGLSTGVISNMPMWDATPAGCYAHADNRGMTGEIFAQVVKPRFGDGIDLIIGNGRKAMFESTAKLGLDMEAALRQRGYVLAESPDGIPEGARRVVDLFDAGDYDLSAVLRRATDILGRNSKGYFLMAEWDLHTDDVKVGLEHALTLDRAIRETAERLKGETLIIFAADHSFDLRVRGGRKDEALLAPANGQHPEMHNVQVEDYHTGEEVLVAAEGPGAERVHGYFDNTDLFHVMMAAFGWERHPAR
jgi:alkaline phosphatase